MSDTQSKRNKPLHTAILDARQKKTYLGIKRDPQTGSFKKSHPVITGYKTAWAPSGLRSNHELVYVPGAALAGKSQDLLAFLMASGLSQEAAQGVLAGAIGMNNYQSTQPVTAYWLVTAGDPSLTAFMQGLNPQQRAQVEQEILQRHFALFPTSFSPKAVFDQAVKEHAEAHARGETKAKEPIMDLSALLNNVNAYLGFVGEKVEDVTHEAKNVPGTGTKKGSKNKLPMEYLNEKLAAAGPTGGVSLTGRNGLRLAVTKKGVTGTRLSGYPNSPLYRVHFKPGPQNSIPPFVATYLQTLVGNDVQAYLSEINSRMVPQAIQMPAAPLPMNFPAAVAPGTVQTLALPPVQPLTGQPQLPQFSQSAFPAQAQLPPMQAQQFALPVAQTMLPILPTMTVAPTLAGTGFPMPGSLSSPLQQSPRAGALALPAASPFKVGAVTLPLPVTGA
jgi:hypothetical protein